MSVLTSLGDVLDGRTFEAVVIGASAGGVSALLEILPGLPRDVPVPVVVVVHMLRGRPSQLAELFAARLDAPVREAMDKDEVAPGSVYFAPADYHLSLEADATFSLSCEPLHIFTRPAIDYAMQSAADVYGDALVGILLTGANHDGAAGLAAIGAAGGLTVVQDPHEAQVPVMPREAIKLRAPDLILPLREIRGLLTMLETR
ncbi:chemotaxis protein CheB [Pseudoduganella namucuonensis]|uniref:protein-glutamate methylesterase n=1 Tax=Pseudoduganella namucuonensis TaxID=1035707 RepID=A0A1I7LV98_9BURK|nr:chemotaxis protein CheB [Pseudoduganella namucuonensis]SFV13579.1 CheB methylesterase [Pseudoduganella namucuonensis]